VLGWRGGRRSDQRGWRDPKAGAPSLPEASQLNSLLSNWDFLL
jgi:hypothetical protein